MAIKAKPIERRFWIEDICSAYHFFWDESYAFQGESHNFWEIVFVSDGAVDVSEDGAVYTLKKNDMILHAPMEFHSIRSRRRHSPEVRVLSFRSVGELPKKLRDGVFSLNEEQAERYLSVFAQISRFYHTEDAEASLGQESADRLQAFLAHLGASDTAQKLNLSPAAAQYRKLVTDMTDRICDNLSLSELAVANNVSISYIKLLFYQYAGISPKAYYTHLRVRHACKLLGEGMSAGEVSEEMHFSSPNYFCVFIKKNTGSLPSDIKKQADRLRQG